MATLVVVLVLVCLGITFVTLAGGFDRVRRVQPRRDSLIDHPVGEPYPTDRPAVRERIVEREVR